MNYFHDRASSWEKTAQSRVIRHFLGSGWTDGQHKYNNGDKGKLAQVSFFTVVVVVVVSQRG